MKNRSLFWLIGALVLVVVVVVLLTGAEDNAVTNWLRELHGQPSGGR